MMINHDLPTPAPDSPLSFALQELIDRKAQECVKEFLLTGGDAIQAPHFQLAEFVGKLQHFRELQRSLVSVFAEACAEDDALSDDWLLISDACKALDQVLQVLFTVTYHYTKVIADLHENERLLAIVASKSDEILEQQCNDNPDFREFLDLLQKPR